MVDESLHLSADAGGGIRTLRLALTGYAPTSCPLDEASS